VQEVAIVGNRKGRNARLGIRHRRQRPGLRIEEASIEIAARERSTARRLDPKRARIGERGRICRRVVEQIAAVRETHGCALLWQCTLLRRKAARCVVHGFALCEKMCGSGSRRTLAPTVEKQRTPWQANSLSQKKALWCDPVLRVGGAPPSPCRPPWQRKR